ncbi:MAG: hypothetical protein AVDCRST_MAG56-7133, partial [uncultured Cytophagales bacterium]
GHQRRFAHGQLLRRGRVLQPGRHRAGPGFRAVLGESQRRHQGGPETQVRRVAAAQF